MSEEILPLFDEAGNPLRKPTDEEYERDPFYWDSLGTDSDDYAKDGVEIHPDLYSQDLDDVGYDPTLEDDSDAYEAERFGLD